AAAARAWETAGYRVRGATVSAMAASVLTAETGIAADTLTRLLGRADSGELTIDEEDVLVIDEAGMVATADLAHLARISRESYAKLVLVGDDRQLPPIGAGGLFRLLIDETGAATLNEI